MKRNDVRDLKRICANPECGQVFDVPSIGRVPIFCSAACRLKVHRREKQREKTHVLAINCAPEVSPKAQVRMYSRSVDVKASGSPAMSGAAISKHVEIHIHEESAELRGM